MVMYGNVWSCMVVMYGVCMVMYGDVCMVMYGNVYGNVW